MQTPEFEVADAVTFECAHYLGGHKDRPEYERIHGHSFVCEVTLVGTRIPGHDWVIDFMTFRAALIEIAMMLDHRPLNNIAGLKTPTLENICLWIFERVSEWLNAYKAQNQKLKIARIKLTRPNSYQACTYPPNKQETIQ